VVLTALKEAQTEASDTAAVKRSIYTHCIATHQKYSAAYLFLFNPWTILLQDNPDSTKLFLCIVSEPVEQKFLCQNPCLSSISSLPLGSLRHVEAHTIVVRKGTTEIGRIKQHGQHHCREHDAEPSRRQADVVTS